MGRDSRIQVYLSDENAGWLTEQAEAAGQSCSEYCREVIVNHIEREENDRKYSRYGTDQHIEMMLDEIREEAMLTLSEFQSDTAVDMELLQRLRTDYMIAIWLLIEDDYPAHKKREAMNRATEVAGGEPADSPAHRSVQL
jgi:Ribbon-helix-helix protein, copG family.